jgi:hypothetical protein
MSCGELVGQQEAPLPLQKPVGQQEAPLPLRTQWTATATSQDNEVTGKDAWLVWKQGTGKLQSPGICAA